MAGIHDRMPVILPAVAREYWLDPEFEGKETLLSSLKPCPDLGDVRLPNPLDLKLFDKSCFLNNGQIQFQAAS